MNRRTGDVHSIYDITYSWRFNDVRTNQAYLDRFKPLEGFVREINPSISQRWP